MPKAVAAKIKSALSTPPSKKTLLIVLAVLGMGLPFVFYKPSAAVLHVGGTTYKLQIAATEATRQAGLAGRANMPEDAGMLFAFDKPTSECFWMKNMRFSLDIIWVNAQKRVVYVKQNIAPSTYPATFCPTKPAAYAIELHAGEVAKRHIVIGEKLDF